MKRSSALRVRNPDDRGVWSDQTHHDDSVMPSSAILRPDGTHHLHMALAGLLRTWSAGGRPSCTSVRHKYRSLGSNSSRVVPVAKRESPLLAVFPLCIPVIDDTSRPDPATRRALVRLVSWSVGHSIGIAGNRPCHPSGPPTPAPRPPMERQIRGPPATVRHVPLIDQVSSTAPPQHPPSCEDVPPRAAAPRHASLDFHQALGEAGSLDPPTPARGDRHSRLKASASKSGNVFPRGLIAAAAASASRGGPPTGVTPPQGVPLEVGDSPPSALSLGPRVVDSVAPM